MLFASCSLARRGLVTPPYRENAMLLRSLALYILKLTQVHLYGKIAMTGKVPISTNS